MDGYGYVSELPAKQKKSQKGLLIFQGNTSKDNEDVDGTVPGDINWKLLSS